MFSVQLCWEITGTEGELDEETPGGDDDQDGGVGPRLHERQAEGRVQPALSPHLSYILKFLQEEELRASQDPKYQHLQEDLHVEITAFAPPAEAHARIAFALTEVRKYLIPDSNDEIRQEQMRELEIMTASGDPVSQATLLLNPSLAGLATLQGLPTGTVNNAFVSSSFQPASNIVLPAALDTSEPPASSTKEGLSSILKSPSSCSSAKIRQAAAPYTKHV